MSNGVPTEPGYYWAKLKTPSDGTLYNEHRKRPIRIKAEEGWVSDTWEIVHVWDNYGTNREKFGVDVFGVPVTQWVDDFYWGAKIEVHTP